VGVQVELERLAETMEALRGVRPDPTPYGIALSDVGSRAGELRALIEEVLVAFVEVLSAPELIAHRVRLHRLARRLALPSLALCPPPRIQNEPLGGCDGLDPAWLARIERWTAAVDGVRPLALGSLHAGAASVTFGDRDLDALFDQVLAYELDTRRAFPRELAALLAIANGIMLDGVWYLAPLSDWRANDSELVIGPGSSQQGKLTLVGGGGDLLRARLVDRDDDGSKLASFASFSAFIDTLLGTP
jgi:hypothetical protein